MEYSGEPTSRCWCGNSRLEDYSAEYLRCRACETLVIARMPDPAQLISTRDESGFYGRDYYEKYLIEQFGFPSLPERARNDLPERCLYWLRTLLRYRLPPGKALEIGSAHGGFVALLRWAGYDATGLEVSPWLVEFARRTFEVPMLLGPIEQQALEAESFDVIGLLDVLEHMPDPVGAMRRCAEILKPGGLLLIQTPCLPEGKTHAQLVEENAPFLSTMVVPHHLFLFSRRSLTRLLADVGLRYVQFEPNLFPYDMFLVAGRDPLAIHPREQVAQRLEATPPARLVRALLDLDGRYDHLQQRYTEAEADRVARLQVIHRQGAQLGELDAARSRLEQELHAREVRLAALGAERDTLNRVLGRAERSLRESQLSHNELHRRIGELTQRLEATETARTQLHQRLSETQAQLAASEADRASLRQALEGAEQSLTEARRTRTELEGQIAELTRRVEETETARAQLQQRLHDAETRLSSTEAEHSMVLEQVRRAQGELGRMQVVLDRMARSYVYRAMRAAGLWGWLASTIENSQGRNRIESSPNVRHDSGR